MMGWNDGGWNADWWLAMTLAMIAIWGGVIAMGIRALRNVGSPSDGRSWIAGVQSTRHANEVLAERFARGEIDEDEYSQRKAALRRSEGSQR